MADAKEFKPSDPVADGRFPLFASKTGLPLAFLLAAAASAHAEAVPTDIGTRFEPGSLAPLLRVRLADDLGGSPAEGPPGTFTTDPETRTVQWLNWPNWPNWFNCVNGFWRNC